ncbi:hypothetical protein LTR53_003462 [Teratosphaeriaceae sp. CCFEE 6253]|nr:hypothetical protein LTR53_003462 [Teratosphaeriaceae sp. CCFEE 6253]
MAAHSPAASPRLPSPPPIAEDQLGPASPGVSPFEDHGKLGSGAVDTGAGRRIRPGTRADEMAEGPPLIELQDIDSAFPLTEHLKALHHHHTHPPESTTTLPLTPDLAALLAAPPPNTARDIWLYELARFLVHQTNAVLVALFADDPPCSPHSCPEMRASEWQYLCAVHDPPKSCAAIDYCCHTLDWAATALSSSKMFPSRLGLGSGSSGGGGVGPGVGLGVGLGAGQQQQQQGDKVLQQQMREITNIFRRVYRIYAHAWFQHREMFWRVEGRTGLYGLFKRVCDEYGLILAENYTIPKEAEGVEPPAGEEEGRGGRDEERGGPLPQILARAGEHASTLPEPAGNTVTVEGNTTKRHRHTKSDLANMVTPVIQEEAEEDDDDEPLEAPAESQPDDNDVEPLQRQATELRSFAESLPQPAVEVREVGDEEEEAADSGPEMDDETGEEDTELADEPGLGVRRSDTVKPPPPSPPPLEARDEDENGEAEEGEEAAVEGAGTAALIEVPAHKEDEAVEMMNPVEAPAAEAEEAGKSVAD